ncbi:MAG: adenine phosphoribosyltransferase, partial [Clostridia bacterium]|nr:adenine phosphoribosyltransferase [Clostridia bacterium]
MLNEQELKDTIRSIPDYPIEGVLFRDITTLVKNPEAYHDLITTIADQLRELNVDIVIGPEARGFVIGSAVAYALGAGFVLARKPGKLPCEVYSINYGLEYGSDRLEIHKDAVKPGDKIVIVDDLIATGGTVEA